MQTVGMFIAANCSFLYFTTKAAVRNQLRHIDGQENHTYLQMVHKPGPLIYGNFFKNCGKMQMTQTLPL